MPKIQGVINYDRQNLPFSGPPQLYWLNQFLAILLKKGLETYYYLLEMSFSVLNTLKFKMILLIRQFLKLGPLL